jgi:hypothetical protein
MIVRVRYVTATRHEAKRGVKRRNSESDDDDSVEPVISKKPRLGEKSSFVGTMISWMGRIGKWLQPSFGSVDETVDTDHMESGDNTTNEILTVSHDVHSHVSHYASLRQQVAVDCALYILVG